jgi:YceI-like domain
MIRWTEADAQCVVYTYKEGLLSAVAHDLEVRCQKFSIEWDAERHTLEASFDPSRLTVLHAMKEGSPAPDALSDRDKRKIEGNIQDDVLETRRFGRIAFTAKDVTPSGDAFEVQGELELHGTKRPLRATVQRDGNAWTTRVQVHQPDFEIKPYSAMMGALRIKPAVDVVVRVPVSA